MSFAALELNDQSLLIRSDDGRLHAEPGFARLTTTGIVTGESARAAAWHAPQHVYNQYWCHLNQVPLVIPHRWARHHADLAFAQLDGLWRQAGRAESLILVAPGSFTEAQLSLLLGMLKALPTNALAVVDSALAACLEAHQDTLFVDLQLHQSVLTLVQAHGGSLSVAEQEVLPDLGIQHIHNAVARVVSDLLIDGYRFDPLHASASEQFIYDRIPSWLTRLHWDKELSETLQAEQRTMPFILRRDVIRERIEGRLVNLHSFLSRHPGKRVVLAHGSSLLASLSARFGDAEIAAQSAAVDLCLAHFPQIEEQSDGLVRVREWQRGAPGDSAPVPDRPIATHLYFHDRALDLSRPVSVSLSNGHVKLLDRFDDEAALTIVMRNGLLETLRASANLDAELPRTGHAGEILRIAGHELRLIEVR